MLGLVGERIMEVRAQGLGKTYEHHGFIFLETRLQSITPRRLRKVCVCVGICGGGCWGWSESLIAAAWFWWEESRVWKTVMGLNSSYVTYKLYGFWTGYKILLSLSFRICKVEMIIPNLHGILEGQDIICVMKLALCRLSLSHCNWFLPVLMLAISKYVCLFNYWDCLHSFYRDFMGGWASFPFQNAFSTCEGMSSG